MDESERYMALNRPTSGKHSETSKLLAAKGGAENDEVFGEIDHVYKRQFGAFKPKFHGMEPGYEPLTAGDYVIITSCTLFVYAICFGMILLGLWLGMYVIDLHKLILGGLVACVTMILGILMAMFCMQEGRIKEEERRYQAKLQEMGLDEESLKRKKLKEQQAREKELAE